MKVFDFPKTDLVTPERREAIEEALEEYCYAHVEHSQSPEEWGSLIMGIMIGARLRASDDDACRVVTEKLERELAEETDTAPELWENRIRTIVQRLICVTEADDTSED